MTGAILAGNFAEAFVSHFKQKRPLSSGHLRFSGRFLGCLRSAEQYGLPIDATTGLAISAPFIVGFTWWHLRRIKRRVAGIE